MTIKAIETRYAGCRFRSRLEARWAVFFDTLGIPWEYEPEGMIVPYVDRAYLPDFWLPTHKTFVEVKATQPEPDYLEMLAHGVDWNGPLASGLLLLGPIPDARDASIILHSQVRWQEGVELSSVYFAGTSFLFDYRGMGALKGGTSAPDWPAGATWDARVLRVTITSTGQWYPLSKDLAAAYEAARSARFEHGETSVPPPRPTLGPVARRGRGVGITR